MTERACDHDIDRIADELRKLIDAAARRADEYLGRDPTSGTCDRCPLCAVLAALRGERSEWVDGLAAWFATVLASLRDAVPTGEQAGAPEGSPPEEQAGSGPTVRRVQVHRVRGTVLDRDDPSFGAPGTARAEDLGC